MFEAEIQIKKIKIMRKNYFKIKKTLKVFLNLFFYKTV